MSESNNAKALVGDGGGDEGLSLELSTTSIGSFGGGTVACRSTSYHFLFLVLFLVDRRTNVVGKQHGRGSNQTSYRDYSCCSILEIIMSYESTFCVTPRSSAS